ncbi:hypothetical protein [Rhodococcus sp. 05-2255-1e]|uniref:hypothetical protein n=1 Tax=Rhodococcus sp. 05-2255-1e TaxID=2022495 RepID=UPI00117B532F|nr:hypothetical protein [Rhodococcus sp. 05-2255-1e]
MANTQILARVSPRESRQLIWAEPGPGLSSNSYADYEASAPGLPIRIGTEKLLRATVDLRSYGFSATALQLVSSKFLALSDLERDREVQEEAIQLLRSAPADKVVSFFRVEARDAHVVGVEMAIVGGQGRMTLRRNGWVTVHDDQSTSLVKSSLQETSRRVGIV